MAAVEDESAHGRTWNVPSNESRTQVQALTDVMAALGRPAPKVSSIPAVMLKGMRLAMPLMREIDQLSYQWTRPYVLDDSAARAHFAMTPTPWAEVCRRTAQG